MKNCRVLIVDDEPLIRFGLRSIVSNLPGIEIAGECGNATEAIAHLRANDTDLVLLDIRLPDSTGLDVVEQVGPARMPAVVFITAYDEYAVRAFELNAVDYLLKPFDEERVILSVERARERLSARSRASIEVQLEALLRSRQPQWPERLTVRNQDTYEFVPVSAIDWIESADNYVQLHCQARSWLLNESMTGLEKKLDPEKFVRVHRQRIVNLSRVTAIRPMLNGVFELELRGGVRLTSGRQYKSAIHNLIGRSSND